ncbi:MAG: hypothetical protein L0312_30905, partial [Acidobacteria bacterium]|nr:hypothetical protein [Acidobacteriota bacterium]
MVLQVTNNGPSALRWQWLTLAIGLSVGATHSASHTALRTTANENIVPVLVLGFFNSEYENDD